MSEQLDKIIRGCQKKQHRYQKKLYDAYASLLYAICVRYLKNREDANDALQEAFIKIYDKIIDFRGEGSFEGWLKRIQVNVCLMQIRKQKMLPKQDWIEMEDIEEEKDPKGLYSLSPTILFEAINELSVGYRTVFNLYVLDGYTHAEIAEELQISEGTSKSQLARAKKILRENLLIHFNE